MKYFLDIISNRLSQIQIYIIHLIDTVKSIILVKIKFWLNFLYEYAHEIISGIVEQPRKGYKHITSFLAKETKLNHTRISHWTLL